MLSLKKNSRSKKSSVSRSSSSRSINDGDYRVVMLCEEFPAEKSSDSSRGSRSTGACSAQRSEPEPPAVQPSRERLTHRRACFVEREPNAAQEGSRHKVYGSSLKRTIAKCPSVVQDFPTVVSFLFLNALTETRFLNAPCYANLSSDRSACTKGAACLSSWCNYKLGALSVAPSVTAQQPPATS